jgi:hypothetical protein
MFVLFLNRAANLETLPIAVCLCDHLLNNRILDKVCDFLLLACGTLSCLRITDRFNNLSHLFIHTELITATLTLCLGSGFFLFELVFFSHFAFWLIVFFSWLGFFGTCFTFLSVKLLNLIFDVAQLTIFMVLLHACVLLSSQETSDMFLSFYYNIGIFVKILFLSRGHLAKDLLIENHIIHVGVLLNKTLLF